MTDSLYHRLFSHPFMVEQLVRDFVPEAVATGLDFGRMERVNAKFHAHRGRRRDGDIIWRLPTRSGLDIYLYFLFEFQSKIDRWMAIRIMVYAGLLWQHLIREKKLKAGDRLPPLLPIVLYNGNQRWNAPTDLADLVTLPPDSPLWPWQPQVRYYLLDEGAFPGEDLARRDSLAALLFRLEHCSDPEELVALVDAVVAWFRGHPGYEELKHLFTEVVRGAARGMAGQSAEVAIPDDLLEVRSMLAVRAQEWTRKWKAEGRAEGEAIGMARSLLKQLARRFGPVPPSTQARIQSASVSELDAWLDAVIDAPSLDDIFR